MKKFLQLAFLLFIVQNLFAQQRQPPSVAIRHVTVIDMTGAPAKRDLTVVISGDRIIAITPTRRDRIARGAQTIDGSGKFLIPGLWDMHVHFTSVESTFPLFIANGVTGIRNMGGELDDLLRWRAAVKSGTLTGPRIITCGPIVDGPKPAAHGSFVEVNTATEARQIVRTLKQRGADCIKVYDRLPRDLYLTVLEEAKTVGLPVVGHVPLSITTVEAADAGQKSIEHLGSILEGSSTLESKLMESERSSVPVTDPSEFPRRIAARGTSMLDTYSEDKARKVFSHLVKNQTWQVPTLQTKWAQTFIDELNAKGDERLKYVPESQQKWWRPETNFFARYRTPEYIVFRKRLWEKELALVGAMHRAGVPFMTGTDLSGAFVFPGFSLHQELELLVQSGFTPLEALQAATRNPAVFLGELNSSGTVEKGKTANLVLLDANPLADIRNSQRIRAVVLNGKYLSKNDLDRLLRDAEAAAKK
ncbi:MAG: amidohydrolase family protein [Pyrinomonadaceae bacterium]